MVNGRPSSRRRLLLIVGLVLLLLTAVLGALAASRGSSTSTGKSEQLLALVAAGDGVKSYDLFSSEGTAAISREEWVTQVVAMKPLLADKNIQKVYTQNLEGGVAETAYNVGEKGSIYRFVIVHNTEDGAIEAVRYNKTSL
jgi:hypothetical protein